MQIHFSKSNQVGTSILGLKNRPIFIDDELNLIGFGLIFLSAYLLEFVLFDSVSTVYTV